jgi:hypothetical protein
MSRGLRGVGAEYSVETGGVEFFDYINPPARRGR